MQLARRVVGALLLAAVLAAFGGASFLWHEGYRMYAVRTGSISPAYPTGTLVVEAPKVAALAVGQVITFRTPGGLVTHRVHARSVHGLTTKGDANGAPDAWTVQPEHVVGVVSRGIVGGGYVLVYFQQPTGVLSLVVLALSVLLAWRIFFPSGVAAQHPVATSVPVRP